MKRILIAIYILFSAGILFYVSLPNFEFPKLPPGAAQSTEPADTETPLRRAYFTDYTRAQVLNWYKSQFTHSTFHNISLPTELLNYPPENAGSIIRDQTRSTFLQEIVHPFRESVFINGYEPPETELQNRIVINGVHYRQKIIIKYVSSDLILRLFISLLTLISIPIIYFAFVPECKFFAGIFSKKK